MRSTGIALDEATYRVLARRSTPEAAHETLGHPRHAAQCLYFRDVPPDLFASIVDHATADGLTRMQDLLGGTHADDVD